MEHRSLISSRFCRGQMTGEEVVELANGSSQVVQQRGLRDAFAPASLFNRNNTRHRAAQDRIPQRRKPVAQKHLQRLLVTLQAEDTGKKPPGTP
jgi:hypothetical protein